ncbi:hypothetical protein [Rhodohalobacter sp.]|uniref:hypothetical protein n=1 Tax=Rhodohalobacter sp. TaxID=1974210 RepID=UPI002ACDA224|nr:hypothetical protein [Rhodohalobacter sp.]MDZ7755495.1 hypothetical protein [Rhodohalobacter sp.]
MPVISSVSWHDLPTNSLEEPKLLLTISVLLHLLQQKKMLLPHPALGRLPKEYSKLPLKHGVAVAVAFHLMHMAEAAEAEVLMPVTLLALFLETLTALP